MLRYKTDRAWFSRLLQHPTRKRRGFILTTPEPTLGNCRAKPAEFVIIVYLALLPNRHTNCSLPTSVMQVCILSYTEHLGSIIFIYLLFATTLQEYIVCLFAWCLMALSVHRHMKYILCRAGGKHIATQTNQTKEKYTQTRSSTWAQQR